jgi:hypothetical protein
MDKQIENVRLRFQCHEDWERMPAADGARHCGHCQKKVYDFTDARQEEFLLILAENNNNVCGRFRTEQMASKHFVLPAWKKWVSAAMVLIGVNIFNNKVEAQRVKPTIQKQRAAANNQESVVGIVVPDGSEYKEMPEFIGGYDGFNKFLLKNLHFGKGMTSGRVIASFDINANGKLNNCKIERGLGSLNDNEVLRVLKLSPKWKPAMQNGKPVACRYYLPVAFKK